MATEFIQKTGKDYLALLDEKNRIEVIIYDIEIQIEQLIKDWWVNTERLERLNKQLKQEQELLQQVMKAKIDFLLSNK